LVIENIFDELHEDLKKNKFKKFSELNHYTAKFFSRKFMEPTDQDVLNLVFFANFIENV
jgi:hypothetical protein